MKYEKPEVVVLPSAVTAVQNISKDGDDHDTEPSDATYRCDE
jgi:hypothetical protein